MKNYRLKKEAVKFFKEKLATEINELDVWGKIGVDIVALEEVEDAHILYGHKWRDKEMSGSNLAGWDQNGSHFHFTIVFPSVKHSEHDKFHNGRSTRELMDRIQSNISDYYNQFVNE